MNRENREVTYRERRAQHSLLSTQSFVLPLPPCSLRFAPRLAAAAAEASEKAYYDKVSKERDLYQRILKRINAGAVGNARMPSPTRLNSFSSWLTQNNLTWHSCTRASRTDD